MNKDILADYNWIRLRSQVFGDPNIFILNPSRIKHGVETVDNKKDDSLKNTVKIMMRLVWKFPKMSPIRKLGDQTNYYSTIHSSGMPQWLSLSTYVPMNNYIDHFLSVLSHSSSSLIFKSHSLSVYP